jgi:Fe-S-cluster containining protein
MITASTTAVPTPIIFPEDAVFSCHQCGDCCRGDWLIPLTPSEIERLRRLVPGIEPSDRIERIRDEDHPVMARRTNGHCVYLDGNVCAIHRDHGEAAKPATCRIFPFCFRRWNETVHLHLSRVCPSVRREAGARGEELLAATRSALAAADPIERPLAETIPLAGRLTISLAEYRELENRLVALIGDERWALDDALLAGERLIQERAGNARRQEAKPCRRRHGWRSSAARPHESDVEDPAIDLVLNAIAGREVMPGLHRYLIATVVTTIERVRPDHPRGFKARIDDLRRLTRLLMGKGSVSLGAVDAPVDLIRTRAIPWPRRDRPDLGPLRRYIRSHLRHGILLLAPDIEYGYHLLLGAYAVVKFYARASAEAAGRESLHAEDLWRGVVEVERNLLMHRPLRGRPLEKRLVRGWFRKFLFHPAYASSVIAG